MSRILFVMLHPGFVRYYDEALDALVADGHEVHVAFEVNRTKLGEDVTAARLAARSPRLTCGPAPERHESVREFLARADRAATRSGGRGVSPWSREGREETWDSLATTVRLLLDYLRFFEPAFAQAPALRARAEKRLPRVYRRLVQVVAGGGSAVRAACAGLLAGIERLIPSNASIDAFIRRHDPDLLLVTPLIELGSQQVDYVKSARRLGIRSALCVASWDNLTSKGLVRVLPDHVIVWNEAQKREAVDLHGVAASQVIITGAQPFDRWFGAQPSRSREEFCRLVGLDPHRPFVLYVGSSIFIAPDEVPFAERWLAALRDSGDPGLSTVGVLIRPHPANSRQWRAFEPQDAGRVAIWPPIGTDPNAADFRRDYLDSLYHCAAVVGINTSAQLEAGIVGRPVLTLRAPEFAHAQAGTLHFQHLVGSERPLVQDASTMNEHLQQLASAVRADARPAPNTAFVEWFIRPYGADSPATPRFAMAVGELARMPRPAPRSEGEGAAVVARPLAFLLARVARALAEDRPLWVYPLRPAIAGGVRIWALAYRLRGRGRDVARGFRRLGRRARSGWYESSQVVGARSRRVRKKVAAGLRGAGSVVRAVGRERQ